MLYLWTLRIFFATSTVLLGAHYFSQPLRHYYLGFLNNFDYGIIFNSTDLISRGQDLFMSSRGVHTWADNQDYFQIVLSLAQFFPNPHVALITMHTLGIFSVGLIVHLYLKKQGFEKLSYLLPTFFWLHPFMINMNQDVVHTEAFATLFVLCLFISLLKGNKPLYWISLILAVLTKEDVAITTGALLFFSFFIPELKIIDTRTRAIGFSVSIFVFGTNFFLVLPYAKELTCQALGYTPDMINSMTSKTASPFFHEFLNNPFDLGFYQKKFFNPEARTYLLKVFWPLLPMTLILGKSLILVFPAVILNLIAGGYFIKGEFHYQHSVFAITLGLIFIALTRLKNRKLVILWTVYLLSVPTYLATTGSRPILKDFFFSQWYWKFDKQEQLSIFEALNRDLPKDVAISADYNSIVSFLDDRNQSYMLPAPFQTTYFGLYNECDFHQNPPPIEVLIFQDSRKADFTKIEKNLDLKIKEKYELVRSNRFRLNVYVLKSSLRFDKLTRIVRSHFKE